MIISKFKIDGRTRLLSGEMVCLVRNKLVKQRYRKNPIGMFIFGNYSYGFVLVQGSNEELLDFISLARKEK